LLGLRVDAEISHAKPQAAKKKHPSFAPWRLCVRFECGFSAEMAI
jgi:hypothetical protein